MNGQTLDNTGWQYLSWAEAQSWTKNVCIQICQQCKMKTFVSLFLKMHLEIQNDQRPFVLSWLNRLLFRLRSRHSFSNHKMKVKLWQFIEHMNDPFIHFSPYCQQIFLLYQLVFDTIKGSTASKILLRHLFFMRHPVNIQCFIPQTHSTIQTIQLRLKETQTINRSIYNGITKVYHEAACQFVIAPTNQHQ